MHAPTAYPGLRATPVPALPVADLICGTRVEEAAALLPRLFNLCRVAQATAARAAFGLDPDPGWQDDLRREILREHVARLCLKWPALLCLPAVNLPRDWQSGGTGLRVALFGASGQLPENPTAFSAFLGRSDGVAPILRAIGQVFAPSEGCRTTLPSTSPATLFDHSVSENSVAARQADHPVLRGIEARMGRGPLWSAVAVAYDLECCLNSDLPRADLSPGRAIVPAARGFYGVSARVVKGRIVMFKRITPTDHLLAPGGVLEQSLASLPAARATALAPLLLAILDPCYPIKLEPSDQWEAAYA